jgi:hypothetical protein
MHLGHFALKANSFGQQQIQFHLYLPFHNLLAYKIFGNTELLQEFDIFENLLDNINQMNVKFHFLENL